MRTIDIIDIPATTPLCDEIEGLQKGFINLGNAMIYFEEHGEGTPVVLLHGGPGATHHVFHPHFNRLAGSNRVIYYDQRGTGNSRQNDSPEPFTIRQAVLDLEGIRKSLAIDRMILLGHSYGGFLGQCYALEFPERLIGLVLVASDPGMPSENYERSAMDDPLSNEEKEKLIALDLLYHQGKLTSEQHLYNKLLYGDWKRWYRRRPTDTEMARSAMYEWLHDKGFRHAICGDKKKIDLKGRFDDFEVPTLLMEPACDPTWSRDKPAMMQTNQPIARTVIFGESGHSPFCDEAKRFFAVLRGFIAGIH